jgi:serine/threonine protein kinase
MSESAAQPERTQPEERERRVVLPTPGETITSLSTQISYVIGQRIGEGFFGVVFECSDGWHNHLAAKVLKETGTYEKLQKIAVEEVQKLRALRHPHITYVYDAFEYRDTFYIITERCYCPLQDLFGTDWFVGAGWILPVARCLLQAINYLHLNGYAHQDIHAGNVFTSFPRNEMAPAEPPSALQFKVGDLGVSKLLSEIDAANTLNNAIRPPEAINSEEFGPMDHRIDLYQAGLLLLQLAKSQVLAFTPDEILNGRPRQLALELEPPLSIALEKALRRHVMYRTNTAMEFWRDLQSPGPLTGTD